MADVPNSSFPAEYRAAAEPVTFNGTVGLFSGVSADTEPSSLAVLFASPWGLEEMCTRKFWRIVSEKLSDRGIANLRFDYPATGDALDQVDFTGGLAAWADSLVVASERLKAFSGCEKIVVVSQGLGALIVAKAAARLTGLEAVVFLAPAVSGRMHLRETAVWAKVVDENLGLSEEQRFKDAVAIASFIMPAEVADEVRRTNLMGIDTAPALRALVVERADRPSDKNFAARLAALGVNVTEQTFEGYERLVSNPAVSRLPLPVADGVVDWIAGLAQPTLPATTAVADAGSLVGDGFRETPVRFGSCSRLFGIICEPLQARSGATVLFLTSAYDRHAGWGRTTAMMARDLARSGIASLRFDTANAGDSPPMPGLPDQVLYDARQNADVSEAVDFLTGLGLAPIVAAGRCSGAYLALQATLADTRLAGIVSVNPAVFRWRPGRSVEEAILNGTRRLEDYGQRALRPETVRRLLKGEVDVTRAAANIFKGAGSRIKQKLLYLFRGALPEGRAVYAVFEALRRRDVPVTLIYSENDLGLEQRDFYFGRNGRGFARFPNVFATMIANADHNLTPQHARVVYMQALKDMALRFRPGLRRPDTSKTEDSAAA
jgi:pimeloyl-ACP methyl ester carboxylesterase